MTQRKPGAPRCASQPAGTIMNPAEAAPPAGARLVTDDTFHTGIPNFMSGNRPWPTCKVLGNEHDAADVPAGDRVAARGTQGGAKVQALPTDARNGAPNDYMRAASSRMLSRYQRQ